MAATLQETLARAIPEKAILDLSIKSTATIGVKDFPMAGIRPTFTPFPFESDAGITYTWQNTTGIIAKDRRSTSINLQEEFPHALL